MLQQSIIDKLNEQINLEFYSSNVYLQMSSWCSKHGFAGAATFLLRHADEELEHMQKLFDYVCDHEKHVTAKINELVEVTFAAKDYSTFNFLQWYVAEQHEEEKLFNEILDKFVVAGESNKSLYFIDKDLETLDQGAE